ncbi:uncharacterized protein LOC111928744 [Cyanistes caeruleus]|uniref:uncharacterized protein LOC111928744 n=1 Tax=Cyanistes caeruleus TaxID=156563 RepID=UPI000CDA74DE|nr:uncharacterized protein LOC111928744 [Cyanistes caeruleus]
MDREKVKPNSQPAQGHLLSLQRRPRERDEAGRRGQWTEKAKIFSVPREPSPLHMSSSSSPMPIKLPPVDLRQPKVGTKRDQFKASQLELRQPQAAPQGSRSRALSLCGDRLPPLPPLPWLPPQQQLPPLPQLPYLVSPRGTRSQGTELGRAGEKGPQPCSPCPGQSHTPVPRVLLPPLRVAQEGTAPVSPSWQLQPLPPIPSGTRVMEHSLTGTAPEKQENYELSQGENDSDPELSPVTEDIELSPGDSKSDQELSPVEDDTELLPVNSTSDEELSLIEEAIELCPGDSNSETGVSEEQEAIEVIPGDSMSDLELSSVQEDIEVISGDSVSDQELSSVQEDIEVIPGDSMSDQELSSVQEDIKVIPRDSMSDQELSSVQEDIEVIPGDSMSDQELSSVQEDIEVIPGDSMSDQELSSVQEDIEVIPRDSMSDQELSSVQEDIEVIPGDSMSDQELSSVQEDIEVIPRDSMSDQELSSVQEDIEVIPRDSMSDQELSSVQEDIEVIPGDSMSDQERSSVQEDIKVIPGDSMSDLELSQMSEDVDVFQGDSMSGQELSPVEESIDVISGDSPTDEELSPVPEDTGSNAGDSKSDKELSQGHNNEGEKVSPEDVKDYSQLCSGEDCGVQDMSQRKEAENAELSDSEEWEDEVMPRMALRGGMERGPSSSRELPGMGEMSCHQKVLDWLDANFPNDYGVDEEEDEEYEDYGYELLSSKVWNRWKEQAEARLEEVLCSMSFLGVTVGDLVLSKRKRCREQKMSRGEDGTQAKVWNNHVGLVDDEDPLEGPSSRYVGAGLAAEAARALPELAAAKKKPRQPLGAEEPEAQSRVSEKRPSRFRRALRALFLCSCLRPQPEE